MQQLIIISAVVVAAAFVGFAAAMTDPELFTNYCAKEARTKRRVDNLVFHPVEREDAWQKFLTRRSERIKFAQRKGFPSDCRETLQEHHPDLVYTTDDELFEQFCAEERQLQADATSCATEAERRQIEKFVKHANRYRTEMGNKLGRQECPESNNLTTNLVRGGKLDTMKYLELCERIVFYNDLFKQAEKIAEKTKQIEFKDMASDAEWQMKSAALDSHRYCDDYVVARCCGDELVDEYQLRAPVKVAQRLLATALKTNDSCKGIRKIEKFYRYVYENKADGAMKEQYRQAHQICSAKRNEVKDKCEKSIFKKLG